MPSALLTARALTAAAAIASACALTRVTGVDDFTGATARSTTARGDSTTTTTLCTFEARLPSDCACAAALRPPSPRAGGGILFPSLSPGVNAFYCSDALLRDDDDDDYDDDDANGDALALAQLSVLVECEKGCAATTPPLSLAAVTPPPTHARGGLHRHHLGSLEVERRRRTTLATYASTAAAERKDAAPLATSPPPPPTTTTTTTTTTTRASLASNAVKALAAVVILVVLPARRDLLELVVHVYEPALRLAREVALVVVGAVALVALAAETALKTCYHYCRGSHYCRRKLSPS